MAGLSFLPYLSCSPQPSGALDGDAAAIASAYWQLAAAMRALSDQELDLVMETGKDIKQALA